MKEISETERIERRSVEFFLDWLADNEIIEHLEKDTLFKRYFGEE